MKTIDYNDMKWYDDALLINVDPNWYGGISALSREAAVNSAKEQVMKYVGRGITDVLYCLYEQTSIVPSEAWEWRGAKFDMTEENGVPVDYSGLKGLYSVYEELGVDPYKIILDTLRDNGIRPWVTLRMNDCHNNDDKASFLRSNYYYEAKAKGYMIGSNGSDYGYYNHCLNYSVPEVREKVLAYIEEILGRYDMFGLELDFMREIYSFDHEKDKDCGLIMNDFMGKVNDLIDAAEQKWGHDIKLLARVPRSIEASVAYGFDVNNWVENDLVDGLVPSPRWEVSDSGIPVSEWMTLVDGKDIAVFPCVEILNRRFTFTTSDISRGYAAAWYSQGADGLYAYNHMGSSPVYDDLWDFNRDNCIHRNRKFVVTFQDICPKGVKAYRPLPLELKEDSGCRAELPLNIGEVDGDEKVILTFGFLGENVPAVTVNGIEPSKVENKGKGFIKAPAENGSGDVLLSDGEGIVCEFTGLETVGDITVTFEGSCGSIDYAELKILTDE